MIAKMPKVQKKTIEIVDGGTRTYGNSKGKNLLIGANRAAAHTGAFAGEVGVFATVDPWLKGEEVTGKGFLDAGLLMLALKYPKLLTAAKDATESGP